MKETETVYLVTGRVGGMDNFPKALLNLLFVVDMMVTAPKDPTKGRAACTDALRAELLKRSPLLPKDVDVVLEDCQDLSDLMGMLAVHLCPKTVKEKMRPVPWLVFTGIEERNTLNFVADKDVERTDMRGISPGMIILMDGNFDSKRRPYLVVRMQPTMVIVPLTSNPESGGVPVGRTSFALTHLWSASPLPRHVRRVIGEVGRDTLAEIQERVKRSVLRAFDAS